MKQYINKLCRNAGAFYQLPRAWSIFIGSKYILIMFLNVFLFLFLLLFYPSPVALFFLLCVFIQLLHVNRARKSFIIFCCRKTIRLWLADWSLFKNTASKLNCSTQLREDRRKRENISHRLLKLVKKPSDRFLYIAVQVKATLIFKTTKLISKCPFFALPNYLWVFLS